MTVTQKLMKLNKTVPDRDLDKYITTQEFNK